MTDETQDKVLLIAVLEIVSQIVLQLKFLSLTKSFSIFYLQIFLTFIAIFSIGFISVPNLFIQGAIDRANHSRFDKDPPEEDEPDYEGIESGVTQALIFVDFFLSK